MAHFDLCLMRVDPYNSISAFAVSSSLPYTDVMVKLGNSSTSGIFIGRTTKRVFYFVVSL